EHGVAEDAAARLGAVGGRPAGEPSFVSGSRLLPVAARPGILAGRADGDAGCLRAPQPGVSVRSFLAGAAALAGAVDLCDVPPCDHRPGPDLRHAASASHAGSAAAGSVAAALRGAG